MLQVSFMHGSYNKLLCKSYQETVAQEVSVTIVKIRVKEIPEKGRKTHVVKLFKCLKDSNKLR